MGLASVAGLAGCGGGPEDALDGSLPVMPLQATNEPVTLADAAPPPAAAAATTSSPAPAPPPPATPSGAWQPLAFPSIMRRRVGNPSATARSTSFDASVAIAVDAVQPTSSDVVPYRAFCRATMGEPGVLYYHGSLHSDYAGNEIDRVDLRDLAGAQLGLSINHQPVVPPTGPAAGYGSGSGAYLYKQYGAGLASNADWQPYTFHNWCYNTWHPAHGYLLFSAYAVGNGSVTGPDPAGNGSGYVQSSMLYPAYAATYGDSRQKGWVRYYKNSRYELAFGQPGTTQTLPPAGISNYCAYRQSMLAFYCDSWTLQIHEFAEGAWTLLDTQSVTAFSTGITGNNWPQGKDGNGLLVTSLDENRFLLYTTNGAAPGGKPTTLDVVNYYHQVYVYDAGRKTMTRVMLGTNIVSVLAPRMPNGDGLLSFAVDRASRQVYAVTVDGPSTTGALNGPIRVWTASFDDLGVWTELAFTSTPVVSVNFAIDREPLKVFNGHLFFLAKDAEAARLHRVKVTSASTAPRFTFTRHDYAAQNFMLAAPKSVGVLSSKHMNLAYRTTNGQYYQMAGDIVESFSQSMWRLSVSTSAYSFATELNEITPAPVGFVRPATTDDGAWAYCGAGNANAALTDKFIWMRGGDGLSLRENAFMSAAYSSDALALADRWTMAKAVIYDPTNHRFTDARIETWPLSQGTLGLAHPGTWPANYARNGAFDSTTNTFFRFCPEGLAAFNFDTRTIRIWAKPWVTLGGRRIRLDSTVPPAGTAMVTDSTWPNLYWFDRDAQRYRTHGDFTWEHQAVWINEADGKLYVVSPATGYLWCFETRGAEIVNSDGQLEIPFGPVGTRMPFTGTFPGATWDLLMHSYLAPFKGGLFYTCDTPNGNSGSARYSFWRHLSSQGEWTPITLPADWTANCISSKSRSIDNDELVGLSGYAMARDGTSRTSAFYLVT